LLPQIPRIERAGAPIPARKSRAARCQVKWLERISQNRRGATAVTRPIIRAFACNGYRCAKPEGKPNFMIAFHTCAAGTSAIS
jgi:hypothetical protein